MDTLINDIATYMQVLERISAYALEFYTRLNVKDFIRDMQNPGIDSDSDTTEYK